METEQRKGASRRIFQMAACTALGLGCALAFQVNPENYVGKSAPPASSASYLWSALGLLLGLLFFHVFCRRGIRPRARHWVLGLVFGVLNALGTALFAYDTWSFLQGPLAWGKMALQCLGQGLPMAAAMAWADRWLTSGALVGNRQERKSGPFPRLWRFYEKRPVLSCVLLFLLCWSPYLLVYFPGTLSWDMGEMLHQFFGHREMDTWHPVFTTWVVGACFWLGRLFSGDTLGAFLFTLLQTCTLAYALAKAVESVRRLGASRLVQGLVVGFFALVPIWGSYAQFICKDTLYTATLLLFALKILEMVRGGEAQKAAETEGTDEVREVRQGQKVRAAKETDEVREVRQGQKTGAARGTDEVREVREASLWALLTCLLRSNGLYVVLPTAVLVVAFALRGKARWRAGAALGSAVLVAALFTGVLLPALGIKDETASGLYSVCFQQSARTLRDHGDRVTAEEYAQLDAVLDAARLPELYEPWISDPVKYTFKQYGQGAQAEKAALARYQKTWLSMLRKYPLTYLEAFVAGNSAYYAFTPKMEGPTYNNQAGNRFVFETHPQVATNLDVHLTPIAALEKPRLWLAAAARGMRHVPVLSLLYCCAAYTWLLAAAAASLWGRRRWRDLTAFAPALLSLGVCLLSPVNDYFRYFLPLMAMTPTLVVFACRRAAPESPNPTQEKGSAL